MKFENKNDLLENFNFDANEENLLRQTFDSLSIKENMMTSDTLCRMLFLNLPINGKQISTFLQSYYDLSKLQRKASANLTFEDDVSIAYLLLNANANATDSLYYKVDTFYILYDILIGTYGGHKENTFNYKDIKVLFEFLVQIFIEYQLPKNKDHVKEAFDQNKFDRFLKTTFIKEDQKKKFMYKEKDESKLTIDREEVEKFLGTLVCLESFLKMYFRLKFFNLDVDILSSTLPIYFEPSEILSTDQFLFLCLSNPYLRHKMAFKFYDTNKDGFYIPNAIYSFMGFEGPIAFIIKHIDSDSNKECVLGAIVNSNIRESFKDKCSGDENTLLFSFNPKLEFYKVVEDPDKILYVSSKRFSIGDKDPGIGFGSHHEQYKLWIDTHDTQHKSYFMKYDDVFEDGTPFDEAFKHLNIANIEIYGFGSLEEYNYLMVKKDRNEVEIETHKIL